MNCRRFRRAALFGMVTLISLIGSTLPATAVAQSDQPAVNMVEGSPTDVTSWAFDNANLAISAGQTVTWTNMGSMQHTVTADDGSFDSGLVDPGNTFSMEFDDPGTYSYHCTPHPWMKATITVS